MLLSKLLYFLYFQACVLMNNVQNLRVQLQKMFEGMGGDKLEPSTQEILEGLQSKLNGTLEKLATQFAHRYCCMSVNLCI